MQQIKVSPALTGMERLGMALAAPMALLQAVNVVRVVADPGGFADYMGAPLASGEGAAWVGIYALRAAFIAALVAILMLLRDAAALRWVALAGLVMPLGDAWIANAENAPPLIVGRHLATAAYILVVFVVFSVAARRRTG